MLIIGTNMDGVNDTKAYLSSTFQMKDLVGVLHFVNLIILRKH